MKKLKRFFTFISLLIGLSILSGCTISTGFPIYGPRLRPIGDPCDGIVQFPTVNNPTHWFPGYTILCPSPNGQGYYEKWIPGHYE